MIPKELFKKIRRIEITTSRLVTDVFAGQYHSVFKGQGIEFDEVREYRIGDDVRSIDWNVTARTGTPHVKKFVEERELTVMILVDVSASCQFSSIHELKSQLAAEISATLALSAIRNQDKVGLIMFTDKIEKFVPPRKGLKHVLHIIREVLYFEPEGKGTNIVQALEYLNRVTSRKSISFLISDFFDGANLDVLKRTLAVANKRHDMIAVTLNDRREWNLPDCGLIGLKDAESQELIYVDTSDEPLRKEYQRKNISRLRKRKMLFRSVGMDHIDISTDKPFSDEIVKFFMKRKRR
ncbi:hypothetical protein PA3071 [hydrothermal vent metagenome]|uniref:VWFA domain-containing protein n=1 Tax=hydrothermal vent metagenome TaxID=652676 RepID=A0A3B1DMI8_9ZZZZ